MDADRFDILLRSLARMRSRRGVLSRLSVLGLAGILSREEGVAKKKRKKKRKNQHLAPPPLSLSPPPGPPPGPPPPSVVCPPVCPICQGCNAATGQCEGHSSQQSLPAPGCTAPKVCCGGACCGPIHQCNSDGTCATCSDVILALCHLCVNLADGSTIFGDGVDQSGCVSCTPNNPCSSGKKCVTSYVDRSDNIPQSDCGPVGSGFCSTIQGCN